MRFNINCDAIIRLALKEDMPGGDVTSLSLIPGEARSQAVLLVKAAGIVAGLPVARRVFEMLDSDFVMKEMANDGDPVRPGQILARLAGRTRTLLAGERTALNFLQRLSGIATETNRYVEAIKGTKAKILDTRKTTPGLRMLEKYAVRMGGGENHRLGLSDLVLIKDNHLVFVKGIKEAVMLARKNAPAGLKVEVEVKNIAELEEAIMAGADMIMLDNMDIDSIKKAVEFTAGRVPLEASGGVNIENVRSIAETGVNFISVGALTHSYKSLDISLELSRESNG